jgi:hypothetical protein
MAKSNPFEYIDSINFSKKNMMRNSENDSLSESQYNPWLTNIALSYFPDTILHANLVNQYWQVDHRPQYEFLINSIRPKKRYSKWVKTTSDEDLDFVCEFYQCNKIRGKEYLSLLSSEQLQLMREQKEKGGKA